MSFSSLITWAASGAIKAVGGSAPGPIGDVKTSIGALVLVFGDLHARKVDVSDTEGLVNAIQSILVDAGIEPKVIEEAIIAAETIIPIIASLYRAAGVEPFTSAPRGGPPITEGNWSGIAVDNHADNPSGEIGGPT